MIALAGLVLASGVLIRGYQNFKPPPPTVCGTPNGPPVTSPRVKLDDGRHLAYKEIGVPKEVAAYKVILVHGIDSSKDLYLPLPQEMLEELGIYVLTFDRAGYGESDPNPKRSLKSDTFDIQELADKLDIGPKFYLIGISIGSYTTWGCLRYLPHRLAGVALVVPLTNFWWPSFPPKLAADAFCKSSAKSQRRLQIAHHLPSLLHWWMNQKMELDPSVFSRRDIGTLKSMAQVSIPNKDKVRQQGLYESIFRDMKIGFGKWEFDPMELSNPFPNGGNTSVHLWQGGEDNLVPRELQRYLANKLPWINYHEVPDGGHLIIHEGVLCEAIFRTLLLGEKPSL
uniref:AB hydrolase-1 domain-containing protein n=1 Tax=Kalanchoe fedtschenkoi TaxID=63787 RepID=A0A7N0SXU7_KALFE